MTPNLFSIATSELSQDAMFTWLIKWADPTCNSEDPQLHKVAQSFLRMLLGVDNMFQITSVKAGRQWEHIDVWAEINDDSFLVLEDKTGTSEHSNQLVRYRRSAEKRCKGTRDHVFYAYVKTGNEPRSILSRIEQEGYKTIKRKDIIEVLNQYEGNNQILVQYLANLAAIEDRTNLYRTRPIKDWCWETWQGFYIELENRLSNFSWSYVANQTGGFLGAYWHFKGDLYLQLEQDTLCFKLNSSGANNTVIRNHYYSRIKKLAVELGYTEISKPKRFGSGKTMTLCTVSSHSLYGDGIVNIDLFVEKIEKYQNLIDMCIDC